MEQEIPPDLDELRRETIEFGLGDYYLPTYESEDGTLDLLRPYGPKRFLHDLIELALDAYYREEPV